MRIILASGSARRAEVLRDAGIPFDLLAANVDESPRPGESAEALVRRLAETKARAAAPRVQGPALVVGADTVVVVDTPAGEEILGKPADAAAARTMLRQLSGRTHRVISGVCVLRLPDGAVRAAEETTQVTFAPLVTQEIESYVASGEPLGKAGAYAIQGCAGRFVQRIEGCYFNVVGLPLARLYGILRELGWSEAGR